MYCFRHTLHDWFCRGGLFFLLVTVGIVVPQGSVAGPARSVAREQQPATWRTFRTGDRMVGAALVKKGWRRLTTTNEKAGLVLHCRGQAEFSRRPNWWAYGFLVVGLFPISFEAGVEYHAICSYQDNGERRTVEARGSQNMLVWGYFPDVEKGNFSMPFDYLFASARAEAAIELVETLLADLDTGNSIVEDGKQ